MKKKKTLTVSYFTKNITIVIGLVLIWRGIWYVLDWIDLQMGNNHAWTTIPGIAIGLLLLYMPDRDLKEIEKL